MKLSPTTVRIPPNLTTMNSCTIASIPLVDFKTPTTFWQSKREEEISMPGEIPKTKLNQIYMHIRKYRK